MSLLAQHWATSAHPHNTGQVPNQLRQTDTKMPSVCQQCIGTGRHTGIGRVGTAKATGICRVLAWCKRPYLGKLFFFIMTPHDEHDT